MKLSVRISLTLALLSMAISSVVAGISYFFQLESATQRNQALVAQLAEGAQRASAIAVYVEDAEFASEILAGLDINDLISHSVILDANGIVFIGERSLETDLQTVEVDLLNPFIQEEKIGSLIIYTNDEFIQKLAREASLQTAFLLLGLSLITAMSVGRFVRHNLTIPLKKLSDEVLKVDVTEPTNLVSLDIGYRHQDEIGLLVEKVNSLMLALQTQHLSEYELRKATEALQKRFRLLFEQSTAGIGLLEKDGKVNISNPAMNQLFGVDLEGKLLPEYFEQPHLLQEQIATLQDDNAYTQVSVDLISYKDSRKRYLHCLLSTIKDSRQDLRDSSEHLIEIMIYDVTQRRELEHKARYEADHDSLTNLLNRRSGTIALSNLLNAAKPHQSEFAVVMIDLDKFKPINDDHGHDVGDVVLKMISERLQSLSSNFPSVCIRWGGDEFLLGLEYDKTEALAEFADTLLSSLQQNIAINDELNVSVGASIGLVQINAEQAHSVAVEDVIKKSDTLMYQIKLHGKNSYLIKRFESIQ